MSSLFKSKTTQTQAPFESNPWEPQQEYLLSGFSQGSDALTKALQGVGAITDTVADLNPTQQTAIGALSSLGLGQAQDVGQNIVNAGNANLGNLSQFGTAASGFNDYVNTDRTSDIMSRGAQYADNPYLQGQIDSALSDVNRAFQSDVGNINAAATGSGNINSTRAGALEARALDDAMDRAASVSSNMRSSAYESGLDRSLAQDQSTVQQMLQGAGLLSQSGLTGLDALSAGLNTQQTGLNTALNAGSILQGQNQAEIDGKLAQAQMPMDLINQYMQIVGGNYGSQGYNTQVSQSASPFQQLVGATSTLMGAF